MAAGGQFVNVGAGSGGPSGSSDGSLYFPLMWGFLKRLIKWALIIAAATAAIRWLKNKRAGDDAEQDPGSIEPWPPLEGDVPAGESPEESSGT